jgi:hypothetical protein
VTSALVAVALAPACLAMAALPRAFATEDGAPVAIKGVVVDDQGRGVEGASIYVEADPARPVDVVAGTTDAAGSFEIPRIAARRVLLRVAHAAFAPAFVPELVVAPGAAAREPLRITLLRGARMEGVIHHRDGRPFTAGRVVVQSSGAAAAYAPPEPVTPDEGGGFSVEHLSPGTAQVYALAFTPGRGPRRAAALPTLSPIGTASVHLRDGETTALEIALRDVVVSGRVTKGGRGLGGIRVTLSGPSQSVSFLGMPADAAPADPPMLSTTTREDGTYDVVAFAPGPARVSLSDAASGEGLAVRSIVVADVDRHALDLEVTEATVAGVVVRREDGTPLADVLLSLVPVAGGAGTAARGRSAADGRFAIGTEPGEYLLRAEVLGRVPAARPLDVSLDGLTDLRLEMGRGLSISGRLLDESGRPVPEREVFAFGADGFERTLTGRDGRFRIEGLSDRPYALSAGLPLAGFALRSGVKPGPEPVALTLRAGGRIALRVLSPEGRPVAQALASVLTVDGERVDPSLCAAPPTDDEGRTTLGVPAGQVALAVQSAEGATVRTLALHRDETMALEVRLER